MIDMEQTVYDLSLIHISNIGWKKDSNSCLILKAPKTTKSKRIMLLSDPLVMEIH